MEPTDAADDRPTADDVAAAALERERTMLPLFEAWRDVLYRLAPVLAEPTALPRRHRDPLLSALEAAADAAADHADASSAYLAAAEASPGLLSAVTLGTAAAADLQRAAAALTAERAALADDVARIVAAADARAADDRGDALEGDG